MGGVGGVRRLRWGVRIGAPDPTVMGVSGMAAVCELVDRLGRTRLLDRVIGPIRDRDWGHPAGEVLVGLAAAQLAGEEVLVGAGPLARRGRRAGALAAVGVGASARRLRRGWPRGVVRGPVAGGGDWSRGVPIL